MNLVTATDQKLHPPDTQARSARHLDWLLLAAILALATLVCALHIADKTVWVDEGVSFGISQLSWPNFFKLLARHELNMAPYYLVLRLWMNFGVSEGVLRTPSAIFFVANVAAIFLVGRRLFGTRAAAFASLLATAHSFLIRYAQEARSYSLVAFLATLSCFFFVRNIQEPGRRTWRAYIITTALAVYSHFFALLVVLAQWISLKFLPEDRRPGPELRRAWKILAISLLPMVVFIATRGAGPISWISRPNATSIYYFLIFLTGNVGNSLLAAYFFLLAIAAAVLIFRRSQLAHASSVWGILFVFSWLIVPIVVSLIFSLARPVFLSRYLIICVPALVLLAGAALVRLPSAWLQVAVMLFLFALSMKGVRAYYRGDFDVTREDWRGVTKSVLAQSRPGDGLVFHAALGRMPFEYYEVRDGAGPTKPAFAFPDSGPRITPADFLANAKRAPVTTIAQNYSRIWLVLAHNQWPGRGPDDVTRTLEAGLAKNFSCSASRQFTEIQVVLYWRGDCLNLLKPSSPPRASDAGARHAPLRLPR
ncbi:MAG TPA: glycosyltransferase family 39 protein [Terriglobales bacterium]|nr:glycosyltransferase family 39 protein [Terriglobales bacterium]